MSIPADDPFFFSAAAAAPLPPPPPMESKNKCFGQRSKLLVLAGAAVGAIGAVGVEHRPLLLLLVLVANVVVVVDNDENVRVDRAVGTSNASTTTMEEVDVVEKEEEATIAARNRTHNQ